MPQLVLSTVGWESVLIPALLLSHSGFGEPSLADQE